MTERRIEYVPLSDIAPAARNPKGHDLDLLTASVDRFGYVEPVVLDERTGRLISGHGRLETLAARRDAGHPAPDGVQQNGSDWLVPVVRGWSSSNDEEAEAVLVVLNQGVISGGWDVAGLAAMLEDLAAANLLSLTGFTDDNLRSMLDDLRGKDEPPALTDPDDVPEIPDQPRTQHGDVWLLGPHRLACGDATDPDVVKAALGGLSIDLVFTSPPYNVGVDYDNPDEEWDDLGGWDEYEPLLRGSVAALMPHLPAGRALCWNIGVSPKTYAARQMVLLEELGLVLHRQLVWRKVGVPVPLWYNTERAKRARTFTPNYTHEIVLVYGNGPLQPGGPTSFDTVLEHDVFTVSQQTITRDLPGDPNKHRTGVKSNLDRRSRKVHPAPFPVDLPRVFAQHLADLGAVVYDPFAGVASTLIAAHRLGRVGVGVELSAAYVDAACERWQRHTGQMPVLEATGEAHDFTG